MDHQTTPKLLKHMLSRVKESRFGRVCRIIWLFSYSDFKTIIVPKTVFGLLHTSCTAAFGLDSPHTSLPYRVVMTLLWTWVNLLPFLIDNQRQRLSILEDSYNKPWRPLPMKMLSLKEAQRWMLTLYAMAVMFSFAVGSIVQCLALIALGVWYNHFDGAQRPFVRNFINASGFVCYASGAMNVACGGSLDSGNVPLIQWFLLIWCIVFTSVQIQDLQDQPGDKMRGRLTLPLVIGDAQTRWIISIVTIIWSAVCSLYWRLPLLCAGGFFSLGLMIAWRCLRLRSVSSDTLTFRIWNLWMIALYLLPLSNKSSS